MPDRSKDPPGTSCDEESSMSSLFVTFLARILGTLFRYP